MKNWLKYFIGTIKNVGVKMKNIKVILDWCKTKVGVPTTI